MSSAGDNQQPSIGLDPADNSGLGGAFRFILRKAFQQIDKMLPATVIAIDAKRQFVTVQPQIMVLGTDGSLTSRAQYASVPLFNIGGGMFVLSFPVKAGDFGWIFAADRDISLFIQKNAAAAPNTNRQHKFSDGVFVPDAMRQWALADEDQANAVWQSYDGTIKITLGMDKVRIIHPTLLEIVTPLVTMSGDLTVTGTITGQKDVLAGPDNISGKGHTHGGVMTGGGSTGEPNV